MRNAKTLGELLEMAMADLKIIETDPKFKVNMTTFYREKADICEVCLAGASLVKQQELTAWNQDDVIIVCRAKAIDNLRIGWLGPAYYDFYGRSYQGADLIHDITRYQENPKQWWVDMERLLQHLKILGI